MAVRDQSLREALGTLQALGRYNGEPARTFAVQPMAASTTWTCASPATVVQSSWLLGTGASWTPRPFCLYVARPCSHCSSTSQGGSLARLWDTANVPENLRILVVAWLIDSMRRTRLTPAWSWSVNKVPASQPQPRPLRRVIDPSSCNLRGAPKTVEDIFVAAGQNHVVAYENVSHLPGPMQDALCILSTGGGYSKRMLYSNDDEHVINVRRPWMLNGISIAVTQQDAVDRVISVECPVIEERQSSSRQWDEFESALPGILVACWTPRPQALVPPSMKLPPADRPRLVEFALLGNGRCTFRRS